MPFLRRENGEQRGQCIELKGDAFLIGRAPDCSLVLDPQGVSRRHAQIGRDAGQFYLEDLGSRNTTKLNNQTVPPWQRLPLKPGDRINICDVEFVYLTRLAAPDSDASDVIVTDHVEESTLHTLDASTTRVLGSGVPPERKLAAVLDITRNLSSAVQIDAVAPKVLDTLFEIFPSAERAFLVLKDPQTDRLVRKAFKHRQSRSRPPLGALAAAAKDDEPPMNISRSIVNHVLERKQAVLSQDAGNDANLPVTASIADLKIRSVMCAPLMTPDGQALGIIQLDTTSARQFQQEDLDLLVAIACQSAISIQNARMYEDLLHQERVRRDLRLAEQVQRSFLPESVPKVPGYKFFAYYHAAYNVGGDYYDFVPLPGDRIGIALADVSGKGIPAALMMAKFSGNTRYCILTEPSPARAVGVLNDQLCEAGLEERFITLSLGLLDLPSGLLTIASAGHPPLLIRRAGGKVEEVGADISGFPLGIIPGFEYQERAVQLEPGDVVVVYSDGITDATSPSGELYHNAEQPRLPRRLAELSGDPESVGRAILQEIREFSSGESQADDMTIICFGRV
ncbi:SpoIIE family protein phosphatase [Tautonia sociabilis]|uniref:FHA domain-containing protein n=1 Tax=Tautonia sociabilis TaxID=2080755 RepID=A0A432MGU5_9BACT|nr:SpoIIE family protein phosphatase [Tautonia sociabilis]RUL85828.1 FHA domain-containing protein [Tautonia sociabilis]